MWILEQISTSELNWKGTQEADKKMECGGKPVCSRWGGGRPRASVRSHPPPTNANLNANPPNGHVGIRLGMEIASFGVFTETSVQQFTPIGGVCSNVCVIIYIYTASNQTMMHKFTSLKHLFKSMPRNSHNVGVGRYSNHNTFCQKNTWNLSLLSTVAYSKNCLSKNCL